MTKKNKATAAKAPVAKAKVEEKSMDTSAPVEAASTIIEAPMEDAMAAMADSVVNKAEPEAKAEEEKKVSKKVAPAPKTTPKAAPKAKAQAKPKDNKDKHEPITVQVKAFPFAKLFEKAKTLNTLNNEEWLSVDAFIHSPYLSKHAESPKFTKFCAEFDYLADQPNDEIGLPKARWEKLIKTVVETINCL